MDGSPFACVFVVYLDFDLDDVCLFVERAAVGWVDPFQLARDLVLRDVTGICNLALVRLQVEGGMSGIRRLLEGGEVGSSRPDVFGTLGARRYFNCGGVVECGEKKHPFFFVKIDARTSFVIRPWFLALYREFNRRKMYACDLLGCIACIQATTSLVNGNMEGH